MPLVGGLLNPGLVEATFVFLAKVVIGNDPFLADVEVCCCTARLVNCCAILIIVGEFPPRRGDLGVLLGFNDGVFVVAIIG